MASFSRDHRQFASRRANIRRRFSRLGFLAAVFFLVLFHLHSSPHPSRPARRDIHFRPSGFDWTTVRQHHPVPNAHELPTGPTKVLGRVQHDFSNYKHDATTQKRQEAVRAAFVKSWNSYMQHAWLRDELAPVTGDGKTTFGGWAATLVDALDTLWIMDLHEDFYLAAAAAVQLDWTNTTDTSVNLFETTIRHLGGLLSAYDLSGEQALLEKATELGNMIYMAFDTPNRLPGFWLNFDNAKQGRQVAGINDPSASPCSLSLEFTRLAQLTGEDKFYDAISRVTDFLERSQNKSALPGMWPKTIDFRDEGLNERGFTLGALADSLYEYLPKMAVLLGGRDPRYERMHLSAMEVVVEHLLFRPMLPDGEQHHDILFAGDAYVHPDSRIDRNPEGQHLSCFTGGMFALGGRLFDNPAHVAIGERLARGCAWAYEAFPTGLMPEIFGIVACPTIDKACPWDEDVWKKHGDKTLKKGFSNARDPRYILRPEAIESLFILYRITGKEELRDIAWRMFQSIMRSTETILANSAIADVTVQGGTTKLDEMESFWLAETLKYFYLIFSPPDLISLDEYVLNTEAHPFRRPK
ncbi:family 47 putative glycoside hydrolase [Podospora aff. communis PSN243]|uniref:alpha-1,2-Mannosidase n=1 Tax=Podospora aff. communis PSN243 TaxID=3040156 RepID=A0AAV9GDT2_9PEZI|nr:family 47 putative glycoside hydrolase [Podospora aff. communis PSN243]